MPDTNTTDQDTTKDSTNEPDGKTNQDSGGKTKEPDKGQTFDLTVDGEKRSVTLDELQLLAQKSAGADKKFKEASDLRKQAEDGLRMKGLIDRLSDGDHTPTESEVRELAGMLGVDPSEFAEALKDEKSDNPPQGGKKGSTKPQISKEELVEALGFDPAEAKAILDYSHNRHIEAARKEIREISDRAVDKDDVFGKMVVGENKDDRLSTIKDMVAEDVLRRIQDGQQFGAELVAASIQKVRAYLTKFGIPGNPAQYPDTLGLGPGMGLPAEVHSETPIKRISAAEDGDEENFVARIMQKVLKSRGR
jgi:hypothetical protein